MVGKGGNNGGWNVNMNNGTPQVAAHIDFNPNLSNNDTPTWVGGSSVVFDEMWHMVAFTYDGVNESIYVDGALVQTGPAQQAAANDIPLMIGVARTGETGSTLTAYYDGLLDDVRVYNYALGVAEVAQMYYDVTGLWTCVQQYRSDLTGDCLVDLKDYAAFLRGWLTCGIVPASACP